MALQFWRQGGVFMRDATGALLLCETCPCLCCLADTFADTDGTNLASHAPDTFLCSYWVAVSAAADWQIYSNRAQQRATTAGRTSQTNDPSGPILYYGSSVDACAPETVSADLIFTGSTAGGIVMDMAGGLLCRYVDSDNFFLGLLHINNSGELYTQLYEKAGGVWTQRASTNRGVNDWGGSYDSPVLACSLANNAGSVVWTTPYGSESYTSSTNAGQHAVGIYAEVYDFFAAGGRAGCVNIDNLVVA